MNFVSAVVSLESYIHILRPVLPYNITILNTGEDRSEEEGYTGQWGKHAATQTP